MRSKVEEVSCDEEWKGKGEEVRRQERGLCEYVIVHTILPPSPVTHSVDRAG